MLGVPYLPANCRHVTMCGRTKGCLRRQSCSHQWHAPMSCRVRRLLHSQTPLPLCLTHIFVQACRSCLSKAR